MAGRGDLLAECALQLRSSNFDFEVLLGASVSSVWQALAGHVTRQLTQRKGVSLQQLGKFGFYKVQTSMQPPVFLLADRFASTYGVVSRHRPPPAPLTATAEINMSALGNDAGLGSDQTRRTLEAILAFIGKKLQSGECTGRLALPGVGSFTLDGKALLFTFDASVLRTIAKNTHVEMPLPSAIFRKSAVDNLRRKTMELDADKTHGKGEKLVLQRSMSLYGALQVPHNSKHTASKLNDEFVAVNRKDNDKKQEKERKRHSHRHREAEEPDPIASGNAESLQPKGSQILPRFLIPEPRIPPRMLKARPNHDQVAQAAYQREVANIEQAKRMDNQFNDVMAYRHHIVQIHDLQKRAEQSVARRELNDFLNNQIKENRRRSRLKSASTDCCAYREIKILPLEREVSEESRHAEKKKLNQRLNDQAAAKAALKKDRRALDQAESAYFISKLKIQDDIDRHELVERKRNEKESLLAGWSQQKAIRAQKEALKFHLR